LNDKTAEIMADYRSATAATTGYGCQNFHWSRCFVREEVHFQRLDLLFNATFCIKVGEFENKKI
jgi:hypothetical protein